MDPSNSAHTEPDEDRALEILLDAFSSVCSLEEIASAYCRAGCDVNMAGEMLSQLQESRSTNGHYSCNDVVSNANSMEVKFQNDSASGNLFKTSHMVRPRKMTASMGIASGVLGKEYFHPTSCQTEPLKATKPLKLKEPLVDDATCEPAVSSFEPKIDIVSNKDTVEFLFSMLSDGFKLDKDTINDVLGSCGFDVKKTMDRLLSMTSSGLDKGKEFNCDTTQDLPILRSQHPEERFILPAVQRKSADSNSMNKKKSDVSREVLESLFRAPVTSEETPKRTRLRLGLNRTRVIGQKVVSAPLDDTDPTPVIDIRKAEVGNNNKDVEDEEDKYRILRRSAKQSWEIMKAYYEAAVDAFMKGDRAKADYLLEQGRYHNKMARESDEKSAIEILDTRSMESQSDFILDLHTHQAKEAVKLLKFHLHSFAGIPSYRGIKVIVENGADDITKGKRRKLVLKLLEKETIEWTEENPGTIFIRMNAIEPSKMSFANKSKNHTSSK